MMYSTLKPVFRVCKNGKRCVMHYGSRPWLHSLSVYQSNCELVYKNKGSPTKGCGAAKQARVARQGLPGSPTKGCGRQAAQPKGVVGRQPNQRVARQGLPGSPTKGLPGSPTKGLPGSPTKGCGAAKQARVARLQLGSSSSAQPAKLQPGRAQLHMCTGAQMHRCIHAITPL